MKLYTEEQVRNMLDTFILFTGNEDANDYIEYMTPIELPSDEEIDEEAQKQWGNVHRTGVLGFINCGKWMRDKLTNAQ